jgi:hypothetical protein
MGLSDGTSRPDRIAFVSGQIRSVDLILTGTLDEEIRTMLNLKPEEPLPPVADYMDSEPE